MRCFPVLAIALGSLTFVRAQSPAQTTPAASDNPASIEGKVTTAAGQPVRKANLTLRKTGTPPQTSYSATSEADGTFQFTGIPAGSYTLSAERTGYAPQGYGARPGFNFASGFRGIFDIKAAQKLTGRDIRMLPASMLSGKVLDEDGDPVERSQVRAMRSMFMFGRKRLMLAGVATTDQSGEFRFSNLTPDRYILQAEPAASFGLESAKRPPRKPGQEELSYATTFYPGTLDVKSAVPIDLPAGRDAPGMNIPLKKAAVYHIQGRVNGVAGSGQVRVFAVDADELYMTSLSASAAVGGDGTFDLTNVTPGPRALVAMNIVDGMRLLARQIVTVNREDLTDVALTALADLSIKGRVQVEPDTAPPDPKNPPTPAQFRVFLRPIEGIQTGSSGIIVTDADGNFSVPRLNPGKYLIVVNGAPDGAYWKSTSRGRMDLPDNLLQIDAPDSEPLDIQFGRNGGTVDALVSNDEKGEGDYCALVTDADGPLMPALLYKSGRIQPDGHCLLKGIRPGSYHVFALGENSRAPADPSELRTVLVGKGVAVSVKEKETVKATVPLVPASELERLFINR